MGKIKKILRSVLSIYAKKYPRSWIAFRYLVRFKRPLDIKDPKTLNEKILYLSLNSENKLWVQCADKYKVRKYVKDQGLGELLVPLYGRYCKSTDIDLSSLPKEFVIKTNHGCGDVMIVNNDQSPSLKKSFSVYDKLIKKKYGILEGGKHYQQIQPCIIIEERLHNESIYSTSLVDYKVWCFNGIPEYIFVILNRTQISMDFMVYDRNWIPHPEFCNFSTHYRQASIIPCPNNLDKMLSYAAILARPFPEVRVDFYNINNKIYLGELTFTSLGGLMTYFSEDFQKKAGQLIDLNYSGTFNR